MNLKGSKTERNLFKTFAGESRARNKYTFYAEKAREEGFMYVADVFEDTAGKFHAISCVNGKETFNHYVHTNKWIPRGRVFTETKVTTMWTGGVLLDSNGTN